MQFGSWVVTSIDVVFEFMILSPASVFLYNLIFIIEWLNFKRQVEISMLFHDGCVCVHPSTLSQIFKGI